MDGNDNKLLYILTTEGTVTRTEGSAGTSYTYNYFKKDQIGSTRAVLSAVGNTLQNVQSTDYYPFGLAYSTNNLNKNKYLFSGKELQDASIGGTILGLYDFGARQYDPVIGRWMTQDILSKNYAELSPYSYCANNPINLVDLNGMKIDSLSEEEFESLIRMFQYEQFSTQNRLNALLANDYSWQSIGMQNNIYELEARSASIQFTLNVMYRMQSSPQAYALKHIGSHELGGLSLRKGTLGLTVVVNYGTPANLVHELVHVWQFENHELAFSIHGQPMLNDIYKEMVAYRIQYAYEPTSVSGLSDAIINQSTDITTKWVQGLQDANGNEIYKEGGLANVSPKPLTVQSTMKDFFKIFSNPSYRKLKKQIDGNSLISDHVYMYICPIKK